MREAEKPERFRLAEPTRCTIPGGVASELDQPCLHGVQLQTELREPVPKLDREPLRVFAMLKSHHDVVSEAHDHDVTVRVLSPPLVSPQIKDVVRVDVPEQRETDAPCGTPSSDAVQVPFSMTPAASHF